MKKITLILFAFFLSLQSNAQVAYNYGWEPTGLGSWTTAGSGTFSRQTAVPCSGSASARANVYYNGTNTFTSPSLGTSDGQMVSFNFDYKVTEFSSTATGAPANKVEIKVEWANSTSGPWTTAETINNLNHVVSATCATKTITFTPGIGDLYVRFLSKAIGSSSDLYFFYDNITVSQGPPPTCVAPSGLVASALNATSATISWNASSTVPATGYEYYYSPINTAPTTAGTATTALTTNLTGLNASTMYYVWLRSHCGLGDLSSWNGPISFSTPCAAQGIPFSEEFESITTGVPECWGIAGTTTTVGYNFSSFATGNTGKGLRFNSFVNSNGLTSELTTPLIDATGATSLRLSFYFKNPTGGNFQVLVSSDGGATYTSLENNLTGITNWTLKTYNITTAISGNLKVKFKGTSNYGSGDAYIYLDGVTIDQIPTIAPNCTAISSPINGAINISSGIITWPTNIDATGYKISVGTAPGGTDVANMQDIGNVTTYTIATAPGVTYYATVFPYNATATATGCTEISFTTCDAFAVPFSEGFNSNSTSQSCWTVLNVNNDADAWDMDYTSTPFEGNQSAMLYTDGNAGANDDWLISPVITLTGNQTLKFHYRVQSASEPNDFELLLSTTGNAPANFTNTLIATTSYSNTTYVEKTVDLSAYTGNVNIAWHVPAGGLDGWRLYIDNVLIENIPTCLPPTNIAAANISATGVDLTWNHGTMFDFEYVVQPAGTGVPTGSGIAVSELAAYIVGTLTPATNYEVYVRADCGFADLSLWAGPFNFATTCIAADVPYTQNFEAATVPSLPLCTSQQNVGTGNLWTVVNNPGYGFLNKTLRYSYNSSSAANVWFYTQGINMVAGNNYKISYNYGGTSATFLENLKVAYGMSPIASAMTNPLADHPSVSGNFLNNVVEFTPATSGVYYFGFNAYSGQNKFYLFVDNIVVDAVLTSDSFDNGSFLAYPNPVKDVFNLSYTSEISSVKVLNLLGQEVVSKMVNATSTQVDMSQLSAGTYIVNVTVGDSIKSIKVIKQ